MKIGIIGDTHLKSSIARLKGLLSDYFSDVDLMIHVGDYISKEVLDIISNYKYFIGVWGNADDNFIKKTLKEKEIIEIEGYRIGIYHGHGEGGNTLDRAYKMLENDNVDIIIFGHSHQPVVKTKNGILMINPGSPFNKRRERWYSYVILELDKDNINVETKFFSIKLHAI